MSALWTDNAEGEARILTELGALIRANPGLPVVTWAGHCADIPELQKAIGREPALQASLAGLFSRHVDMFLFARDNVRLPIPELSLKEVASYFGIPRISSIAGGFRARMMYAQYQQSRETSLRERLIDCNRDDLDALTGVIREFQSLARSLAEALETCELVDFTGNRSVRGSGS
jgi:predicted RecB family nuclease